MNIEQFIKENNLKEPKTFKDILKLQAILDDNIHNVRERTLTEIKLSLIAELIEFNEETGDSHKTWKSKEWSREKELEELTDVYFFFAQLVNVFPYITDSCNNYFEDFSCTGRDSGFLGLINLISESAYVSFFLSLMKLTKCYGYTKDDVLKTYWNKWQKNMLRIGKEWD